MKLRNPSFKVTAIAVALGGAFSLLAQTPETPPQGLGGPPPGGGPGFGGPPQFGEGGFGPGGPGDFGPGGPGGFGGRGGPGGQQEVQLVKQFDTNGDGWLNTQERKAARESLSQRGGRGGFGGGRRGGFGRGGRGGNPEAGQPGRKLTPADVKSFPGSVPLYDPSTLRTIFLEFEDADWEKELADFKNTDVEVPAKVMVDGKTYKDVGVHFKGMSSFMMVGEGQKRSLVLSFDFIHEKQDLYGYSKIDLLNAHEDPSFLHTVLSLHVAREFLPAPKANFMRVVINGESWGIFANQQHFNKDFTKEAFGSTKGARWKVPGSPGGRGSLAYLGEDPSAYKRIYEIKSKDDPKSWTDLAQFCKVLNQTPTDQLQKALEPLLDVDGALRFLAWENALVNGDGYWTRTSDYSIYEDEKGRFHIVPYDANETFSSGGGPGGGRGGRGGFGGRGGPGEFGGPGGPEGFGGPGGPGGGGARPEFAGGGGDFGGPGGGRGGRGRGGPGGFGGRGGGVQLDPLVDANDSSKPLLGRLLAVPEFRKSYVGYVREIAEKWLDWDKLGPVAKQYHHLIAEDVKADTRKLDSTEEFLASLDAETPAQEQGGPGFGRGGPGGSRMSLKSFADRRRAFLLNHAEVKSTGK